MLYVCSVYVHVCECSHVHECVYAMCLQRCMCGNQRTAWGIRLVCVVWTRSLSHWCICQASWLRDSSVSTCHLRVGALRCQPYLCLALSTERPMQVLTLEQQALPPPCHLPGPHFPILTQQIQCILSYPSCLLTPLLLCHLQAIDQNNAFFQ